LEGGPTSLCGTPFNNKKEINKKQKKEKEKERKKKRKHI
jgi:hypothetical protein